MIGIVLGLVWRAQITTTEHEQLLRMANVADRSLSAEIRRALRSHIEQANEGLLQIALLCFLQAAAIFGYGQGSFVVIGGLVYRSQRGRRGWEISVTCHGG